MRIVFPKSLQWPRQPVFWLGAVAMLFFLRPLSTHGQSRLPTVQDIRNAFERFSYAEADSLARIAIGQYSHYAPEELAWIHIYRGSALYAMGKPGEAKAEFASALSLSPSLQLDPVYFSPKLIQLLEEARREVGSRSRADQPERARYYVLISDPRPAAAWRSFFVPGWGQKFKGERRKANLLFAADVLCAAGLTWSALKTRGAHQNYLNATIPGEIEKRYSAYRNAYRLRTAAALATAAVWAYSFWDALLTLPKTPRAALGPPLLSGDRLLLSLRLEF